MIGTWTSEGEVPSPMVTSTREREPELEPELEPEEEPLLVSRIKPSDESQTIPSVDRNSMDESTFLEGTDRSTAEEEQPDSSDAPSPPPPAADAPSNPDQEAPLEGVTRTSESEQSDPSSTIYHSVPSATSSASASERSTTIRYDLGLSVDDNDNENDNDTNDTNTRTDQQDQQDQQNRQNRLSTTTNCSNRTVRRSWGLCTIVAIITISTIIGVSLKKISSLEYGIEYDIWAKTLDDAAKQGGLFLGPPGYQFVKFPSTQISAGFSDTCLSRDGLRVKFDITYQYQISKDNIVNIIKKYRDYKGWSITVQAAGTSAIQHTCSDFTITEFQNLALIQDVMLDNLKIKLEGSSDDGITDDGVYAFATSLQLDSIQLPIEFKNAVAETQRVEEEIVIVTNQRIQATTKAQTELLAAKEEAQKILDTANNDANVTIIEADLKKEETLFAFKKQQDVLVEAKNKFNYDTNGILSYMANYLYGATMNLGVIAGEPAKFSRKAQIREEL